MSSLLVLVLCLFFILFIVFSDSGSSEKDGTNSFDEDELKELLE